jgi:hypothetical protein
MPVKYSSDVPPASTMACRLCSAISRRAFSIRAARSSLVIGLARSRIEVSAAMLAGRGPVSVPPRLRWADTRVTDRPATALVRKRKERRDGMAAPESGHRGNWVIW